MSCANQAFLRTTQFYSPKYLSKNACILSMTDFFFSCLFPPPNLDIGGSILPMSVPVVLTCPSRKLLSMKFSISV